MNYLTNEANENALLAARVGNLLPRAEWEALDIPGCKMGKRLAHIRNALRYRMDGGGVIERAIPVEWIEEYNELTAKQESEAHANPHEKAQPDS